MEVLNSPPMNLPLVQFWQTRQRGLITARICSLREGNVSVVSVGGSPLATADQFKLVHLGTLPPVPAFLLIWGPTLPSPLDLFNLVDMGSPYWTYWQVGS